MGGGGDGVQKVCMSEEEELKSFRGQEIFEGERKKGFGVRV